MALVLSLSAWTIAAQADVISYWSLDQIADGITQDQMGPRKGVLKGNVTSTSGQRAGALQFAGSGSYVDCGTDPVFNPEKAVTVAAWVKVDVFDQTWQTIVCKGDTAWRLQRAADTDYMQFACSNVTVGVADNVVGTTSVRDGTWHHVVGGYDGSRMFLYVDGRLEVSVAASGPVPRNQQPVWIGGNADKLGREWKGAIDEVAIFDHALTAQQVAYFYRLGMAVFTARELAGSMQQVEKAESALREGRPEAALRRIQTTITEYEGFLRQCPPETAVQYDQLLCDLYFLLGEAQQRAAAPPADRIHSFSAAIALSLDSLHAVPMLTYLSAMLTTDEYADLINRRVLADPSQAPESVYRVARDFVADGNWPAFEAFLDAVFARVDNPRTYVMAVAKGLGDTRLWLHKFEIYCRRNPGLKNHATWSYDGFARYEMERGRFARAVHLYRELLGKCDSPEARASYDYRICRCLFDDGQYAQAAQAADDFIGKYANVKPALIAQVLLLKGRSYAQLGRLDEAARALETLSARSPVTAETDEAVFLLGYLRMREGNYRESARILDSLVSRRPDSSWAGRARLCLSQIPRDAAGS